MKAKELISYREADLRICKLLVFSLRGSYVKLAYLENNTCVEVIVHSPTLPPIFFSNLTLFLSNSLNTKTQLYRSDFSFPLRSFPLVLPPLVSSQNVYSENYRQKEEMKKWASFYMIYCKPANGYKHGKKWMTKIFTFNPLNHSLLIDLNLIHYDES